MTWCYNVEVSVLVLGNQLRPFKHDLCLHISWVTFLIIQDVMYVSSSPNPDMAISQWNQESRKLDYISNVKHGANVLVQCSRNAVDTKPSGKSSENLAPAKFSVLTMLSNTTEKPEMSAKGFDKSKQEQPKLLELHGRAKPKPLTPSFRVCRQETLWWWRLWNLQQFLGCACSVPTKFLIPHSSDIYRQSIIYTLWTHSHDSSPACLYVPIITCGQTWCSPHGGNQGTAHGKPLGQGMVKHGSTSWTTGKRPGHEYIMHKYICLYTIHQQINENQSTHEFE